MTIKKINPISICDSQDFFKFVLKDLSWQDGRIVAGSPVPLFFKACKCTYICV